MRTDPNRVIVTNGKCACLAVHTTLVHHRDFPEIWAEGGSLLEGAAHLSQLLAGALEAAQSKWHRDAIELAIADVAEFVGRLDQIPSEEPLAPRGMIHPTEAIHPGPVLFRGTAGSRY
jgi:hypothetical protein